MLSLFADQLRSIDLTLLPFTLNVNSSFTSKPARRIFPAFFYYLDANVDFGICIWYCIGNKRTSDATKRSNIPSTPCYDEPFEPFPFLWAVRGSKKCLYLRKRNAAVIFIRRSKTFYGGMNFLLFFFFVASFSFGVDVDFGRLQIRIPNTNRSPVFAQVIYGKTGTTTLVVRIFFDDSLSTASLSSSLCALAP